MIRIAISLIAAVGILSLITMGLVSLSQAGESDDHEEETGRLISAAFKRLQTPEFILVVARVNGSELLGTDLQLKVNLNRELGALPEYRGTPLPSSASELASEVRLVVMYQEAVRRHVECSTEEVNALADRNLGAVPGLERSWASFLGVPREEVALHPTVFGKYERKCGGMALFREVADELGLRLDARQVYDEFHLLVDGLVAAADIEILEPSLQEPSLQEPSPQDPTPQDPSLQ